MAPICLDTAGPTRNRRAMRPSSSWSESDDRRRLDKGKRGGALEIVSDCVLEQKPMAVRHCPNACMRSASRSDGYFAHRWAPTAEGLVRYAPQRTHDGGP